MSPILCVLPNKLAISHILTNVLWFQGQYDDAIRVMDDYYLSREDFDTIMELELAVKGKQPLLKRLNGPTKISFTKKYVHTREAFFL